MDTLKNSSQSKRPQIPSIARRTFQWRAHCWQHVLLDDDPAGVARRLELAQKRSKVDHATAQLTEETVADRRLIVPLLLTRALRDLRLAVLEMDVPYARGVL